MKKIGLLLLLVLASACQKSQLSESQGRILLTEFHESAKKGTAQEAVSYGEQALALMTRVSTNSSNYGQDRSVAATFQPAAQVSNERESENIVTTGEQAFVFEAFDESIRIFQMAYIKDPRNERANAYLASLIPLRYFKGLKWRVHELDADEYFKDYLTSLLDKKEGERSSEDQWDLFTQTPYKKKFKFKKDFIDEVVTPETKTLLECTKYWDFLANDSGLDIQVYLTHVMRGLDSSRIRSEDARMTSIFYLGLAMYLKLASLYDMPGVAYSDKTNLNKLWPKYSQNPLFGVLTDRDFYPVFRNRMMDLSQGMDYAVSLLKKREKLSENDGHDLMQFTPEQIISCGKIEKRTFPNAEGFYYDYWSGCPNRQFLTMPSSLSTSLQKSQRKQFTDMKLKYALEDDRARDYALEEQFQKENPKYPLQLDPTWKYYRPNTASLTAHNFHADMKLIREIMNGPQQIDIYCALDDVVLHRSWINFPDYLKNPVEDLKQLRPTFTAKGTLWALQDYSVHGLFPSGYPCMKGSAIYNIESALNPVTISPKTVNP